MATNLTAEQLADLAEMRAEMETPEHLAEMERERAETEAEFPPSCPRPEWAEAMAGLRLAREAKGLSLDAVASRSGIDRAVIARIEQGIVDPSFATLGRLAEAVGVRAVLTFDARG